MELAALGVSVFAATVSVSCVVYLYRAREATRRAADRACEYADRAELAANAAKAHADRAAAALNAVRSRGG